VGVYLWLLFWLSTLHGSYHGDLSWSHLSFLFSLARAASTAFLSHHIIRLLVGLGRRSQISSGVRFVGGLFCGIWSLLACNEADHGVPGGAFAHAWEQASLGGRGCCVFLWSPTCAHSRAGGQAPSPTSCGMDTDVNALSPPSRAPSPVARMKMIISDFRKSFSSFFWFSGLNENGSGNRKNENDSDKNNRKRKRKWFCPLLIVFEDYHI
jgi:hypothetical protein